MHILVTGISGLLAPYIVKNIPKEHNIYTCSRSAGTYKLDLTKLNLVKDCLNKIKPSIIVHCAAYTDVEKAEKYPEIAYENNYLATKNLVTNIRDDCHFIYISTDQVYGKSYDLHKEGEENPVNIYGKSKWLGALEVKKHYNHTILHTNMFGPSINEKNSFSDIIINIIKKREGLSLFSDSFFSPLHLSDIAFYINKFIFNKIYGTYNLGTRNGMSKEHFIKKLASHLNLKIYNAHSIKSSKIESRVKRTLDLRLDVNKVENILKVKMPNLIDNINKL